MATKATAATARKTILEHLARLQPGECLQVQNGDGDAVAQCTTTVRQFIADWCYAIPVVRRVDLDGRYLGIINESGAVLIRLDA
ncbi:MAG: hypothetical protein GX575_13565 [Candidatus Anammoximicrobium sp.]|nr:hypothetical protein [Candidatus Anammoximicrobium sp.]